MSTPLTLPIRSSEGGTILAPSCGHGSRNRLACEEFAKLARALGQIRRQRWFPSPLVLQIFSRCRPLARLGDPRDPDESIVLELKESPCSQALDTQGHQIFAARLPMLRLPALARRLALASLLSTTVGIAMLGATEPRFIALLMPAASAGQLDPLFINLTSDEPHRLKMALSFARQQQALGHPVTIFLNDRGVLVGSKTRAASLTDQQALIAELLASGGTVLICPLCMNHYGVNEAELLNGLKIGNPTKTGAALFRRGSQALSW